MTVITGTPLEFIARLDETQLNRGLNNIETNVGRVTRGIQDQSSQIDKVMNRATQAVGAFFSVQAAIGFVSQLVSVRSEFQQLDIAFSTMLKSKAASDKLMSELITFAGTTPFGLKDAAGAAKQLLAYGSTAKTVVSELRMLGDVASGVSAPIGDLVYLYGTLKTQGRAYAMDIRQFAGRGIPIYAELAKVLGVAKDKVADLVTAGKVGFSEVEQAFKNMTAEGSMFGGLMAAQSATLTGQIERLKDAWDLMLNEIGQSQEGLLGNSIQFASTLIENYETILTVMTSLIAVYGAYKAAVILSSVVEASANLIREVTIINAARLTVWQKLTVLWIEIETRARLALNAVMLVNPYAVVAVAVAALGVAMYALNQNISAQEVAMKQLNTENEIAIKRSEELKTKVSALNAVIQDKTATDYQQTKAFAELQALYPTIFSNLTKEAYLKMQSAEAQKLINEANDKGSVQNLGDRFEAAKNEIITLNAELKRFKDIQLSVGDQGGGIGKQIETIKVNIEAATIRAEGLEASFKQQREDLEYSLLSDKDKVSLLEKQKNEIINQKNAMLELQRVSGGLQTIFNDLNLNKLNKDITAITGKIETLKGAKAPERTVTVIETEIQTLKDDQKGKSKRVDYQLIENQIKSLEAERDRITGKLSSVQKKGISDRQKFLNNLLEIEAAAKRKGLTQDEQAIKEAQDRSKKLKGDARTLGLGGGVITRIEKVEQDEVGDLVFRQNTDKLKTYLDEQKKLYDDYEAYKISLGKKKADERFKNELDLSLTYLEELKIREGELLSKGIGNLSGPETELLTDIQKRKKEITESDKQKQDDLLKQFLSFSDESERITRKYNDDMSKLEGDANIGARLERTKGYKEEVDQLSRATLQKSDIYKKAAQVAVILTKEETIKQIAALNNILESGVIPPDLVGKIQANIDRLKFNLNIGVDEGNLSALKDEFSRVSDQLHVKDSNGDDIILSDEDYKSIIARLAEIQLKIDVITNPKTGKAKSTFAKGLEENFKYLKGSTKDVAEGVSNDLGAISGSFNELSGALGGSNTQAGYLLGTIGELAKVGSDAAGAVASFASGDIVGGITKTISAVSGLFSIGKKVREMNEAARKEVEDFYSNAIKGEREYQDLLKERELQTIRNNKIALQGIRDELALRKSQSDEYAKEASEIMAKLQGQSSVESETYTHGTFFRKSKVDKTYSSLQGKSFQELSQLLAQGKLEGDTKALVERLTELEAKGYDATQAMAALAKETSEIFTGTNADNLTNSLLDMFRNGKTGAQDLAEFFKTTMDDAALSIFKNKVLAGAMEKFYTEFDKAAQSGDDLTSEEIARLNGLFTSLTGDALKKFEEFQKITGSTLTESGSNSSETMVGRVTQITADQADKLVGQFNGFRLSQLETNSILKSGQLINQSILNIGIENLNNAIKIEQNTFRTAENTESLKRLEKVETTLISIDKTLKATPSALGGKGMI